MTLTVYKTQQSLEDTYFEKNAVYSDWLDAELQHL